jgi:hypothetical protein
MLILVVIINEIIEAAEIFFQFLPFFLNSFKFIFYRNSVMIMFFIINYAIRAEKWRIFNLSDRDKLRRGFSFFYFSIPLAILFRCCPFLWDTSLLWLLINLNFFIYFYFSVFATLNLAVVELDVSSRAILTYFIIVTGPISKSTKRFLKYW